MALTPDEKAIIGELTETATLLAPHDEKMSRYYDGSRRLEQLGLAVPPTLRRFETTLNWPRVVIDTIENRQDVRALLRPGSDVADEDLMNLWRENNLDSELSLLNKDLLIYGRAFMCVGANADNPKSPLMTVESPREITVSVDRRTRRIQSALRLYNVENGVPQNATLYMPDYTLWLEFKSGAWFQVDRDDHRLGRVPVVMFLNRRRTGEWRGTSEMVDIIPLTDAAARTLTNLQLAQETLAVPQRYALGVTQGDFVDADGKPLPVWEAYYGKFMASANPDAKLGQLDAANLKNFHDTVNHYGQLASSVTGFPVKYFGQFTSNPAAEGAIRADEAQMVKAIERKNANVGNALGWAFGIAERLITGSWPDSNRIQVEWHDPGTPTFAQKADALQKLAGGVPILSREGAWDELGWSDARKDREREYFKQESGDPYLGLMNAKDEANRADADPPASGDGVQPPAAGGDSGGTGSGQQAVAPGR